MRKFLLNKLVRDGVVPDMEAKGQQVVHRRLDNLSFYRETGRKVMEETAELDPTATRDKIVTELADRKEALLTADEADKDLMAELGIAPEEVEAARLKRREERGGFDERMYVESVTLADDDPWAAYYAKEPDRFKEIPE